MMVEHTSIRLSQEFADELYQRKGRGTSYEEYLKDVLARLDELEEGSSTDTTPEPDSTGESEADTDTDNIPEAHDLTGEARSVLEEMDLPGSGRDYEQRITSVLALYDTLQANPGQRMSKSTFREVLDGHDVGYAGGFDSLWSNWVKSNPAQGHGKNVLCSLPGVELRGNDYVYSE